MVLTSLWFGVHAWRRKCLCSFCPKCEQCWGEPRVGGGQSPAVTLLSCWLTRGPAFLRVRVVLEEEGWEQAASQVSPVRVIITALQPELEREGPLVVLSLQVSLPGPRGASCPTQVGTGGKTGSVE